MKKIAHLIFALLFANAALAADNAVIVTPGTGVTMKSKDVGAGVQAMQPILSDTSGNALSTPTSGADGVSNTATGLLGYARNLVFNGTTWDRWTGDTTNGAWVNVKTSVLPTGAATAAKQPALGTAGSASTDVLTVQGIASMTPFLTNPGTAANWGVGATGSAVPANGQYTGVNIGGNLVGQTGIATGATVKAATVAIVDAGNCILYKPNAIK